MLEDSLNFVICGVQKGGTTALDAYLREHPEIGMADQKELHFFDNSANFEKNVDYSVLHQSFSPGPGEKIFGECTPSYIYLSEVHQRLHEYNQELKLILLLRNPVERAYSHWQMEYRRNYETLSFSEAIRAEADRLANADDQQKRVFSYIDRGRYLPQLERLWRLFPKNNVLILKSEDLKMHPGKCLDKVCHFLGVTPFASIEQKNVHSQTYDAPLLTQDRKFLQALFLNEITALEQSLDWDLTAWKV